MGHRVNVVLDEDAWEALQEIERGNRSRFVSEAVKRAALERRRRCAMARLDALREGMTHPGGSTEQWVREDRERH